MKQAKDYQEIFNLTDKEYIYLLECYYFNDKDIFEAIKKTEGFSCVVIPDTPPYCLRFNDGIRISEEEGIRLMNDNNVSLKIF